MTIPEDRNTLLARLERMLCDASALRSHLKSVMDVRGGGDCQDWDEALLQQVLEDGRRLDLLDDDELLRLDNDPAALVYLGCEIIYGWRPAWSDLFTASGAERVGGVGHCPGWNPDWATEGDEGTEIGRPAGALGRVLDSPFEAAGRARVLDWPLQCSLGRLEWIGGEPAAPGGRPEERGLVEFELRAFTRLRDNPGAWNLTLGGAVPEDRDVLLTVELFGWNLELRDSTHVPEFGGGPLTIDLAGFGDQTVLFEGMESGGAALRIECSGAKRHWRTVFFLVGPVINQGVYDAWRSDCRDGYVKCLSVLERRIGGCFQGIAEHMEASDALGEAIPQVLRRRHLYTEVRSLDELSRLIATFAWKKFLSRRRPKKSENRKGPLEVPLDDHLFWLSSDDPSPERALFIGKVLQALEEELEAIPTQRDAVELRELGGLPYKEIGSKLSISEGAARKQRHDGVEKLRSALERRGIDGDALGFDR